MGGAVIMREYVSINGLSVKMREHILKDVFLNVRKGEFVSIVGKSGAGKTTLLNALAGLVKFEGRIRKPEKTTMVFQNYSLFPWMNAEENIAFGLEKQDNEKIAELIEKTGLAGKEQYLPKQLSGGQQQRVAIARALASNPDLILLDEPFASLDSYTRMQMQGWLKDIISGNGTTIILVTHDVDEAILLSDRVLLLRDKTLHQEFAVPFTKPRDNEIRYKPMFQRLKKEIIKAL